MPSLIVAIVVCRRRHELEWLAPIPRRTACEECIGLTGLVMAAARGALV